MTRKPSIARGLAVAAALAAGLLFSRPIRSHEGHEAEAARGVIRVGDALFLEPASRAAAGLEFAEVVLGPIEETLDVPARLAVAPDRSGFASSRVAGRVATLRARPGDRVAKGDVLAEIESLELESMQTDLVRSAIALDAETRNRERLESLRALRTASAREVIQAATAEKEASAALERARGKLVLVGIEPAAADRIAATGERVPFLPVRAPIDGIVLRVDVERGQFVEATEHLVHIADLSGLRVEGQVPESAAARIREGLEARVRFTGDGHELARTTLARVAPVVENGALRVFADVEDPEGTLRAEGGAVLSIVLSAEEHAVLAPRRALFRRGGETFALVEEPLSAADRKALRERLADEANPLPDWARSLATRLAEDESGSARKIARKPLIASRAAKGEVEIEGDVLPGDRVIVEGGHVLAALFAPGVLRLSEEARAGIGIESREILPLSLDAVARGAAAVELPPGRRAAVSAPLLGTLASVRVREGDAVAAGDVVAEIESLDAKSLSLDLLVATLRLEAAAALRDNLAALADAGIPAGREKIEADVAVRDRAAERDGIRRRLRALGFDDAGIDASLSRKEPLRAFPLRSPIAGRVAAARGAIGRVVSPGDALVDVVDAGTVWIAGALSETEGRHVPKNAVARARLAARPSSPIEGRVAVVGREVRVADRALPVWMEVENAEGLLLPGMTGSFAVVTAPGATEEVLAVPREAVLDDGGQSFVVIESGEGFLRVDTETGRADDRFVEVRRGLYPGDRVLVRGAEAVRTALAGVR